ncbi:NAD-dependent protein deacetylase [Specibacter sp. RAF43]|uniref:NAD-dependent protein deacetylase n=1 Tax=Specibacter sp. RAF43 TaxID=3233057 RepID=UPI003F9C8876
MTDKERPGIGLTGLVQDTPDPGPADAPDTAVVLGRIAGLLRGRGFALLTGAGISTDSGIPDYRGPGAAARKPLTYQEFVGDESLRRRYWARNHLGWRQLRHADPNAGHFAAAALERAGLTTGIITQNVDRLHEDAGALDVVDLHGRFDKVACLRCGEVYERRFIATVLTELNPGFLEAVEAIGGAGTAPDADADLEHEVLIGAFRIASCPLCGGMLKPDFVFFGENVPKDRVERSFQMVDSAQALVVAGSSLTVMSGLRFVKRAARDGKPVVIINRGITRGDGDATVKLEAGVGRSLTYLADALRTHGQSGSRLD